MLVKAKDLENEHWPVRYFVPSEFQCKCCARVWDDANARDAWRRIDNLRVHMGEPIHIVSATRCPDHNEEVGGAIHSQHLKGCAFDISVRGNGQSASYEARLLWTAGYLGFGGIGIYRTFLHVDTRPLRPGARPTLWF